MPYALAMQRAVAPLGVNPGPNTATGGADTSAVRDTGVAVVDLAQDGSDYFDVHHTANDTLAKVDPDALRQSVAAFAVSVWLGAQYPGDWERVTSVKPPRR